MDLGSPEPKDRHLFLPKSQMKDPESIAGKIMVEYNIKAVSYVHMQISARLISAKKIFFPKSQGATSVLPKSAP